MEARTEHLPVEISLSILSYFEWHELFQVFTNLNHGFDSSLLASDHLLVYL
jgi:hypothetical protein